jgi:tRNA A-37 threonylcarbamoyl transferase component Bud32/tetratricopeptide (TPR) repeat protein
MIDEKNDTATAAVSPLGLSLEQLLSEQVRDWMRGDCRPFRFYLERQASFPAEPESIIELINQEIVLRRRGGDTPTLEDYLSDYPDLAEPLSQLFEVYNAISFSTELRAPALVPLTNDGASEACALDGLPHVPGYRIERVLGSGGMGVVYLADELSLKRKVALKFLRQGNQDDSGHRARLEREAAAVAKCQHPNLVQIFHIGEYQSKLYLALEYVDGLTLAKALAGIPQPTHEAAKLVEKLARAVDHAHSRGVVHRDLKPANVLLTAEGEPKITDFGLARMEDNSTRTEVGGFVGTLAYMAPEQAGPGSAVVGAPADIHALGVILYESLTGQPPYRAETPGEIVQKVLFEPVVPASFRRPEVPRDLDAICLKCLEKVPSHRYATAAELAEDLRRFLDGRPTLARPVRPAVRAWRWCRRNPKLAAVSATLAATVLIAAAAFIVQTYRHNIQLLAEVKRTAAKAAESSRNYQQARKAIAAMLARLSDARLAGSPRLIELRRKLQGDALTFYDQILLQNDSKDPLVRADTARALLDAYVPQHALGQGRDAEASVRRAVRLVEGLRSEEPGDIGYMALQADCLLKLATCLGDLNQREQIIDIGRQAVELAERVVKVKLDDAVYLERLAMCHTNLANALAGLGDRPGSMLHYQKATEIRKRIDPSKLPGVTLRLAASLMNEGVHPWGQDSSQAEGCFREAEQLLLSIPRDRRDEGGNSVITLGQIALNWGGLLHNLGRFDESIARSSSGLKEIEPYLRIEPNDVVAREVCLKLHGNRGLALSGTGKHRESADDWKRVVELANDPVPYSYRVQLALELIYARDVGAAVLEAQKIEPAPDISGEDCYNIACIYGRAADIHTGKASATKAGVTDVERNRRVDGDVSAALRWLKDAAAKGLFSDPRQRAHAKEDDDLKILRDRPEFRQLVDQADKKK